MSLKNTLQIGLIVLVLRGQVAVGQALPPENLTKIHAGSLAAVTSRSNAKPDYGTCFGCLAMTTEPRITAISPVQANSGWSLPDRITWVANLALAVMGYAALFFALSILKKIEAQTRIVEAAAAAAAETAQAALLHAQSIIRSERPWIMVTVEPSPGLDGSSIIVATNRGRSPAKIVAIARRIVGAADEQQLPSTPEYPLGDAGTTEFPIILLPAESTALMVFSRKDVEQFCSTGDQLKRVQEWEEKIYVHGKLTYEDFSAPSGQNSHETSWCCWYIYGQQKSGLVTIGLPAYNVKS